MPFGNPINDDVTLLTAAEIAALNASLQDAFIQAQDLEFVLGAQAKNLKVQFIPVNDTASFTALAEGAEFQDEKGRGYKVNGSRVYFATDSYVRESLEALRVELNSDFYVDPNDVGTYGYRDGGVINAGDEWKMTADGTIFGVPVQRGDYIQFVTDVADGVPVTSSMYILNEAEGGITADDVPNATTSIYGKVKFAANGLPLDGSASLTDVVTAKQIADAITALQTSLTNTITTNKQLADTAIADVNGRVDGLETSVTAIDTRLTTAESDIDAVESTVSAIQTSVTAIDTRLTTAESDIDAVETSVTAIDTRLTTAESEIDAVETSVTAIDTRLTTAESEIDAVETSVTAIDTRLTTAEAEIDALQEYSFDSEYVALGNGVDKVVVIPLAKTYQNIDAAVISDFKMKGSNNNYSFSANFHAEIFDNNGTQSIRATFAGVPATGQFRVKVSGMSK